VLHDLQELLNTLGGDVLEVQWRSTAGDERWWRPWRRVVVPGEGPANMGKQGAHKHRGSAGMLSPQLNWVVNGSESGDRRQGGPRALTGGDGGQRSAG
jgi:hypothetical protein